MLKKDSCWSTKFFVRYHFVISKIKRLIVFLAADVVDLEIFRRLRFNIAIRCLFINVGRKLVLIYLANFYRAAVLPKNLRNLRKFCHINYLIRHKNFRIILSREGNNFLLWFFYLRFNEKRNGLKLAFLFCVVIVWK